MATSTSTAAIFDDAEVAPQCFAAQIHSLLPAGTVSLRVAPGVTGLPVGRLSATHAELAQFADVQDAAFFLQAIFFLVKHEFVAIQCAAAQVVLGGPGLLRILVRIYLIPYDLPNVGGRLRVHVREQKVLPMARKQLHALLACVSRNRQEWDGDLCHPSRLLSEPFLTNDVDNSTMAELYSTLDSPNPVDPPIQLNDLLNDGRLLGMRTTLYPYQCRSVEAMICRELKQHAVPNPLYIPVHGVDGSHQYYLQPGTLEILSTQPIVPSSKGGMLCEELGTGKTVMVLALIHATLHQLPKPEVSPLSDCAVLTPLSLRAFSLTDDVCARQLGNVRTPPSPFIPSLREFLIQYCTTQPIGLSIQQFQDAIPDQQLALALTRNVPFYFHYDADATVFSSGRASGQRRRTEPTPQKLFISAATLVVVPSNLLNQWQNEIYKHCDDSFRCLMVRDSAPLPAGVVLAKSYDIILMSHSRFSAEASKGKASQQQKWTICKCPSIHPKIRVPDSNLMGLKFGDGTQSELQYPDEPAIDQLQYPDPSVDSSFSLTSQAWTPADREDMKKLANMMTHFLEIDPFASDSKMFTTHVIAPLLDSAGPRPGSIQVLKQVMNMVMIRHRSDDVEADILLPVMKHETVLLDLEEYGVRSYNMLQAAITINAVDSERKDIDYLFNSRNRGHLLQTIENMSQAMFWHRDEDLMNINELFARKDTYKEKAQTSDWVSTQDQALLDQAISVIEDAMANSIWKALNQHIFVYHQVAGIPPTFTGEEWLVKAPKEELVDLLDRSQPGPVIRNSTSSKLNYILKEVMTHAKEDKILIFSKSPLTLAYIAESLELLKVKSLIFTSKVPLREREQNVTTFETSDLYRIFLMELKHGARGLNLITASRVIFCEPVWQADVETQAIKRVHRIGQTKPVQVKTLAIRSTFEELMLSQRQKGDSEDAPKHTKAVADDHTMRDFIANPTFLPIPTTGAVSISNASIEIPLVEPRKLDQREAVPESLPDPPPLKKVRMPMAPTTANWHWKNKNVTPWAKSWFERELVTVSVDGDGEEQAEISEVTYMEGDVELGQRKSKLITIYDCKVELKWKGTASDGTAVEGKLTIPEVSHEITLDGLSDYVYDWSLTTSSSGPVDAVYKLARSRLPALLEAKFTQFAAALVDTHGKDLQVNSTQTSRTGTPAPTPAPSTSTSTAQAAAAPAKPAPKKAPAKLNSSTVKVDATFMASADDLFSILTDEKRIPQWTRAPAQSAAKADTEYSLFGGGVKGKYILLSPPKEIIQTWALQSPTWPEGHSATLTTTIVQSSDSTAVTWTLDGVPLGLEDEITRNIQGYYVHGLKSIGYVQVSHYTPAPPAPPSTKRASMRSSSAPTSSITSSPQPYVAVAVAVLVLVAAFTLPYVYK
ncbi:hypothetical protein EUX98_g5793 [Antrodiella citrinella]|uniref:Helicase C-terminal domain-containing protein n=1 Tax=Antrodiella citrinella TaxID=2447956 RepID=A0A4S4MRJ9_9APHY|nr:hypothetical protein EUX98_g5793 [Antrodiella citrinella]